MSITTTRRDLLAGAAVAAASTVVLAGGIAQANEPAGDAKGGESTMEEEKAFEFDFVTEGIGTKKVEAERDGLKLVGTLQAPASALETGAPVVIMMHGARGNRKSDFYDSLCLQLAKRGYAILRFDFNGHGDSDGEFDDSTVLNELEDTAVIVEYARALPFATCVAALGHSQGGCVSTLYAGTNPDAFDAIVTVDAAVNIEDNCKSGSLDGKASDAYVAAGKELDIFGTVGGYEGPVCIIHGLADGVVVPEYSERLHATMANSELHLLLDAGHTPATHLDEVVAIADLFLKRHLA